MQPDRYAWDKQRHSANFTDEYIFHQLIPYIGNKRKLLGLIGQAMQQARISASDTQFVDLFAGTGVVSRFAKQQNFRVWSNDWEPYSEAINQCYIQASHAPSGYGEMLAELNALPPLEGWVTQHLCPADDERYDTAIERMFYLRRNGMRIDAIRTRIAEWEQAGRIDVLQRACLLAPLLYQCCYNSNTSGVFKGFHKGWGGQTGTALYRIQGELVLRPPVFCDNGQENHVLRMDAANVGEVLRQAGGDYFVYLDPPYNQHPYGANYHVLNSIALWDKPALAPQITGRGDKSAIRTDWRRERRSAYNYRAEASQAYAGLLQSLPAKWLATSYSTDGMIPLQELVQANHALGDVTLFTRGYKRYRVSSQRFSGKPMNVEFILLTHAGVKPTRSVEEIVAAITAQERQVLQAHEG